MSREQIVQTLKVLSARYVESNDDVRANMRELVKILFSKSTGSEREMAISTLAELATWDEDETVCLECGKVLCSCGLATEPCGDCPLCGFPFEQCMCAEVEHENDS